MNRKKLSEEKRMVVYAKCKGHCAYCGQEIDFKQMQVDHAKPLKNGGEDTIDNMLPACRSCNHYKGALDVEGYRQYLEGLPYRLHRDSIPYKVAIRFGMVKVVGQPVKFYFETPGDDIPGQMSAEDIPGVMPDA